MSVDLDLISRIAELILGISSSIFLFIIMVYRLSYRMNDLIERFKEQNDFIKDFKKNFDDFKLLTTQQMTEIKTTVISIEKKLEETNAR